MTKAQEIVAAAIEAGRKELAKQMYDTVLEIAQRGYGHSAYNTPQTAERFLDEVRDALEEYEAAARTLNEAMPE